MEAAILVLVFFFFIFFLIIILNMIRILREYERGVIFRLGRYVATKGPGLILLFPLIDKMVKVSLRTIVMDVPTQDIVTRDNISIKVSAVVYFRVMMPEKAIVEVQDFLFATSQISQTTLRSVLGQSELDELLTERTVINLKLQKIIDEHTEPWGIKVSNVEVKQIDLPVEMQRAMAKQAEAERERRAKVIHADGEFQASQKLADAAEVINKQPISLQLRYLQTLTEIATEKNSTIIFPLPVDIISQFINMSRNFSEKESKGK